MQATSNTTIANLVNYIVKTLIDTYIVPTIIGLALLVFLYGIFTYIRSSDDEGTRKEGRTYMIYGIIGIFVMVSVWGFVRILTGTFCVSFGIPQLGGSQTGSAGCATQNDFQDYTPGQPTV